MPAVVRSAAKPAKASDAAAAATKNPKRTAHMNAPARPDGYSADDVALHCAKDDAWVIVGDGVYDITEWIPRHPGGSIPLVQYAGRDMTDAFRAYHSPNGKAAKTLNAYRIGDFTGAGSMAGSECESPKDHLATASGDSVGSVASSDAAAPHVAAFRTLVAGLEGEFRTDYRHYYKLFACLAALFARPPTGVLRSLEQLSLEQNSITDKGCGAIASAMQGGALPALREIRLGGSGLTRASIPAQHAIKAELIRHEAEREDAHKAHQDSRG